MNPFIQHIPNHFIGLILLSNGSNTDANSNDVVVVVHDNKNSGTIGLCINHPLRLTLNDFDEKIWGNFNQVPVFKGGPTQPQQIIVTSLDWDQQQQRLKWQLGLNQQQATRLMMDHPKTCFKAYCGHINWAPGQLFKDIQDMTWLPIPLPSKKIFSISNPRLWDTLMLKFYPSKLKSTSLPKNLSLN